MAATNHHPERCQWRRVLLTTTSVLLSITVVSVVVAERGRPIAIAKTSHRTLNDGALNPNLINYNPSSGAIISTTGGYTQEELNSVSQQTYGAPESWVQCPTGYTGYFASYDCMAYIYCKDGKMKEEGYTRCQDGLLFDNDQQNCVWADEVHCDPENNSSSYNYDGQTTATYSQPMNSVTRNPRYQDPNADDEMSQHKWDGGGGGTWGGYWLDGQWIDESNTPSSSNASTNSNEGKSWGNVEIVSWTDDDFINFPLPQLQQYDLAQSSGSEVGLETLPKEFISQEGWSSQSRSSSSGSGDKKVIGYYTNWNWYSNQERPSPENMQFTKVDRINFAFFQTNEVGELWGTDLWADAAILL